MLADLSTCFSWLCFKLSLKFCRWIYFFIVVHCKQPGLFSMCYIKEPFKPWTLSAWIEPWGSLTWLKCCVLMMERMVLGVVWEKFLYLDNIKREIALPFIQQLKFPFLFSPFCLRGGSCGFVFLPTPQIYSETSVCSQTAACEMGDLFQSWAAAGSFTSAELDLQS